MGVDGSDPRVTDEHIRRVAAGSYSVTLVGVVHDHPASVYRTRRIVMDREPDVVALEIPPLAVPLYRQWANTSQTPPTAGGEMSAAIQATRGSTHIGIDGPSRSFITRLISTLFAEQPSASTVSATLRRLCRLFGTTLGYRLEASLGPLGGRNRRRTDTGREPERGRLHDPATQAADERRRLGQARSVLELLPQPREAVIIDRVREDHMATQLTMFSNQEVVAVVGRDHLDPVTKRLRQLSEGNDLPAVDG